MGVSLGAHCPCPRSGKGAPSAVQVDWLHLPSYLPASQAPGAQPTLRPPQCQEWLRPQHLMCLSWFQQYSHRLVLSARLCGTASPGLAMVLRHELFAESVLD